MRETEPPGTNVGEERVTPAGRLEIVTRSIVQVEQFVDGSKVGVGPIVITGVNENVEDAPRATLFPLTPDAAPGVGNEMPSLLPGLRKRCISSIVDA